MLEIFQMSEIMPTPKYTTDGNYIFHLFYGGNTYANTECYWKVSTYHFMNPIYSSNNETSLPDNYTVLPLQM